MELEAHQQATNLPPARQLTPVRQQPNEEAKYVSEVNTQIFNNQHPQPGLLKQDSTPLPQDHLNLIKRYQEYLVEKKSKEEGFVSKIVTGISGQIGRFFHKQRNNGAEFQTYIQKNKIASQVQFNLGNFDEQLEAGQFQYYKPLLVYIHTPEADGFISTILNNPQLATFLNKNFHCLGFLATSEAVSQLRELGFPCDKLPGFYVFRKDLFDKPTLMETFQLLPDTNLQGMILRLKQLKAQHNHQYIMEQQVKKNVDKQERGQFISQQPQQIHQSQFIQPSLYQQQSFESPQSQSLRQSQQIKLQQERELRQQQEAALKQAELETIKAFKRKQEEEQLKKQIEEEKSRIQEEKLLKKAQLLSNIPDEPSADATNIIIFSFRLPDGTKKERRFQQSDLIQNLFDFITTLEEEFFENEDSEFDLIQNFPKLSLLEHKDKQILEIFQETSLEQLIVKEL